MTKPALSTFPTTDLELLDEAALYTCLHQQVEAAWRLSCEVHPELPKPLVWLDLRGKSAGQAHFGRRGLRFNPVLLRENRQAFLAEVVPHEMAHWLVYHLEDGARARPHGHEWQTVMRCLFGLEPKVTHCFDVRRSSSAPYCYRCRCDEHFFTAQRHALARQGRRYQCRQCAQTLVYVGCSKV
ncbi:hypothetical protein L861_22030 [Litchfieldella anticariensis FP35 = DSM 16096]|uniref:SprT-like domain-containing protein n=1 Tax=Litchfieldella anticariensis (strain DSM 16096 / CECT 5854 / CIP 108499 / LMG 22089 / FP35) TaxID=1121939 RepID=S2KLI6_LITA3|nr:SprT-like domain-containing protein [Halomonas anticariensis]EPC02992.1 hypothetical protein L861_22030 [Halomonas anticariensis FP35 = DSM 16096]